MQTQTAARIDLAAFPLAACYTDFMLSRQAMRCTRSTLEWYTFTTGAFVKWLSENGVLTPDEITARHVRQFLVNLEGKSSNTIHGNARAIRTFVKFLYAEGHITQPVKFDMPKLEQKRLACLTAEQVQTVLKAANCRDRALVSVLVDTGLRRAELSALNWSDVDFQTGLVRVVRGKGGKFRTVATGAKTRRYLLAWRRQCPNIEGALFQTSQGERLEGDAIRRVCKRLGQRTGVQFSPHALRRTAATLLLKSGCDLETLRRILGHSSLEMLSVYVSLMDGDIQEAARKHSPIDLL